MKRSTILRAGGILILVLLIIWFVWNLGLNVYDVDVPITGDPSDCEGTVRFAVIGDYGDAGAGRRCHYGVDRQIFRHQLF